MASNNSTMRDLITKVQAEGNKSRNSTEDAIDGVVVGFEGFGNILDLIYAEIRKQTTLMSKTVLQLRYQSAAMDELVEDFSRMMEFQSLRTQPSAEQSGTDGRGAPAPGEPGKPGQGMDISGLLGLSAVAIGSLVGAFKGWIKAIDFFTFGKSTKWIASIEAKFLSIGSKITGVFMSGLEIVKSGVLQGLSKIGSFLKFDSPAVMKVFAKISQLGSYIIAPFVEAGKMLGSLFKVGEKVGGVLGFMSNAFGKFGTILKATSGIVSKLAFPVMVIMTAFDTIKGAIDGFATGGIMGALEGAITGFFNSLIFGPLDLIKDMISWVVGMFGFENAAATLDSFSFSDIFSMIVGALFDAVSGIAQGVIDQFKPDGEFGKAWTYLTGLFGSLTDTIKQKFTDISDFVGSIPDRMWIYAQEMWVDITTKLKKGFILFGDWFASIPARIKYMALSTIREYDPTGYLVSEEAVAEAKSAVDNRSSNTSEKIAQVDREAETQMQSINAQKAALLNSNAAQSSNVTVAPQTNVVNGGNSSNVNSNSTTIINAAPHQSLNAFMPI